MSDRCLDCWEQLAYYILEEADSFGAEHAIQKLREIYVLMLEGKKEKLRELFEGEHKPPSPRRPCLRPGNPLLLSARR